MLRDANTTINRHRIDGLDELNAKIGRPVACTQGYTATAIGIRTATGRRIETSQRNHVRQRRPFSHHLVIDPNIDIAEAIASGNTFFLTERELLRGITQWQVEKPLPAFGKPNAPTQRQRGLPVETIEHGRFTAAALILHANFKLGVAWCQQHR